MTKRRSAFATADSDDDAEGVIKHNNMWWATQHHPMSDAQFMLRFAEHQLIHSHDPSLRAVRARAFFLIKQVMSQTMHRELEMYREDYPDV